MSRKYVLVRVDSKVFDVAVSEFEQAEKLLKKSILKGLSFNDLAVKFNGYNIDDEMFDFDFSHCCFTCFKDDKGNIKLCDVVAFYAKENDYMPSELVFNIKDVTALRISFNIEDVT